MRTVLLAYLVVIALALIGYGMAQASAGPLTSTCHTFGQKC